MCSRSHGFNVTSQAWGQVCLGKVQTSAHDALLCVGAQVWTRRSRDHAGVRPEGQCPAGVWPWGRPWGRAC